MVAIKKKSVKTFKIRCKVVKRTVKDNMKLYRVIIDTSCCIIETKFRSERNGTKATFPVLFATATRLLDFHCPSNNCAF